MTSALFQQQPRGLYCNHQQGHGDSGHPGRAKDLKQKLQVGSYPPVRQPRNRPQMPTALGGRWTVCNCRPARVPQLRRGPSSSRSFASPRFRSDRADGYALIDGCNTKSHRHSRWLAIRLWLFLPKGPRA
jgi:hypothetical protein